MKKPLTTAPIVTKDESLSPPTPPSSFNGKITLSNQSEPEVKIQSNTVEDSKGCSNKVNAFSRLMASKGKIQKNKTNNGKGAEDQVNKTEDLAQMKPLLAQNEADVLVSKDNDNLTVDENNVPKNDQIETIKESSEPVSILSAPK